MFYHVKIACYHWSCGYQCEDTKDRYDEYYVAYKPISLSCISFRFIEMKFIYYHSCVIFTMKSMSICNDSVNYNYIIIQWSLVFKHML